MTVGVGVGSACSQASNATAKPKLTASAETNEKNSFRRLDRDDASAKRQTKLKILATINSESTRP